MMRALATLVLSLSIATPAAAQSIGRLFFTPAERAQLDAARVNKRAAEPPSAAKSAEPPPPHTQVITYNGIVRRSDGKATLWLNSRPADEKEALSSLPVSGRVRADGGVTLQVPSTGSTIDLRVGQRAELQTGRVSEARADKEKEKEKEKSDAGKSEKSDAARGDAGKSDAKSEAPTAATPRTEPAAKAAEPPRARSDVPAR